MSNNNFFNDDNVRVGSIMPAGNTAGVQVARASPSVSAMLLASADRDTQLRITKEAVNDSCRALLAYSAMENVLALSTIADYCTNNAPSGEHRYKSIVDVYTSGAAQRIVRW